MMNSNVTATSDLRKLAKSIARGLTTPEEKITAMFAWVRDEIRYVLSADLWKTPRQTLRDQCGDCADRSWALAGLLRSIGVAPYHIQIYDPPGVPRHVMVGIPTTQRQLDQLYEMTGGEGRYHNIGYKDMLLAPLDAAPASAYIGWIDPDYTHWTSNTTWRWCVQTDIWPFRE